MNYRGYIFTSLVSLLAYWILLFKIPRTNFPEFIILISVVFIIYYYQIKSLHFGSRLSYITLITLHVLAFFSIPTLSDDYFRFIFDGELFRYGISPYQYKPSEIINRFSENNVINEAFQKMNSKEYYSVYPPFNQIIFLLSAGKNSVLTSMYFLKLFIVSGNIILFFTLQKLAKVFNFKQNISLITLFNPLLLIETTGNLHFEALTCSLLLISVLFLYRQKIVLTGIISSISFLTKLVPLLIFPFLIKSVNIKNKMLFYIILIVITIMFFLPFISISFISNFFNSLHLFIGTFEFNASIFHLINFPLSKIIGFDATKYSSLICVFLFLIFFVFIYLKSKKTNFSIFIISFHILFLYYLFSSTVHPWYFIYILIFGVISETKSAIYISALILISYNFYDFGNGITHYILNGIEYFTILYFYFKYDFLAFFNGLMKSAQH